LETWIDRLNLTDDPDYQKHCINWKEKMENMNSKTIKDQYTNSLSGLYECWLENINRGSNQ
jgi:hypothetical protein